MEQTHILLTGASRGIGAAIAERLGNEEGVRLVTTSSASGDLSDPGTPSLIWNDALEQLDGRIDVLINNAGVPPRGHGLSDLKDEELDLAMRTHFHGPLHLMRAVLPMMRAQGYGRIVNVSLMRWGSTSLSSNSMA